MTSIDGQRQAQAVRQLFRSVGGLEAASEITGISKSHLQRCSDPRLKDSLTIRDLFLLEEVAQGPDGPPVTLLCCQNAGGRFEAITAPSNIDNIHRAMSVMSKEFGDTAAATAEAAAQGDLTEAAALIILKELQEQITASNQFQALLMHKIGKNGAQNNV
jgi:hypothetical protein